MKTKIFLVLLPLFLLTNTICSQETKKSATNASDSVFGSIDTLVHFDAVPTDPVFDMLGLNSSKAEMPGTVSKFFAGIMSASDVRGNLNTGFAVSFAPYQIARGNKLLLRDYIENWGTRFLSNIQVSAGTAPSKNADSSLNWGFGIKFVFWNSGDKRLDTNRIEKLIANAKAFLKLYSDRLESIKNKEQEKAYIDSLKDVKFSMDKIKSEGQDLKKKQKEINTSDWNAKYALELSLGAVYRATNSNVLDNRLTKVRVWLNGGLGFNNFQVIGQVGLLVRLKEKTEKEDSLYTTASLNMRYGSSSFRMGLGAYAEKKFENGTITVAGEIRLSSIGWLTFSVDRNLFKGKTSTWSHSVGIKTTVGTFNF